LGFFGAAMFVLQFFDISSFGAVQRVSVILDIVRERIMSPVTPFPAILQQMSCCLPSIGVFRSNLFIMLGRAVGIRVSILHLSC
jgi:hypothetical protein